MKWKYTLIHWEQNHYSEIIKNAHVQMIEPMPDEQAAAKILRGLQDDSARLTSNQNATGMRRRARKAIQDACAFDPTAGRVAGGLDDALDSPSLQKRYLFSAGKL